MEDRNFFLQFIYPYERVSEKIREIARGSEKEKEKSIVKERLGQTEEKIGS